MTLEMSENPEKVNELIGLKWYTMLFKENSDKIKKVK